VGGQARRARQRAPPAVLGHGVKAEPLSLNAEDAQLLATRQFQIEEIARIYGVPPFMIGHTDKTTSWGSGVETMGKGFVRFTLRQHLNKFQNELNRKFFRNSGKVIEFDTFDLESADMETLVQLLRRGDRRRRAARLHERRRDPQPHQPAARPEARRAAQRRRHAAARRAGRRQPKKKKDKAA
jgi:phage portal protein BeeE